VKSVRPGEDQIEPLLATSNWHFAIDSTENATVAWM